MLLLVGKTSFLVTLLFILLWIFCGGGLLLFGGCFLAKSQKATFWRSCGTNLVAVFCGFLIQIPLRIISSALHRASDVQISRLGIGLTLFGVFLGILISWWIIKISFTISFPKAILAWLPSTGQFIVFIALYLFWPISQQPQPLKEYTTPATEQITESLPVAEEIEHEFEEPMPLEAPVPQAFSKPVKNMEANEKAIEQQTRDPESYTIYLIRAGDTPESIAERFLGDPNRWNEIQKANPDMLNATSLRLGQRIKIPEYKPK